MKLHLVALSSLLIVTYACSVFKSKEEFREERHSITSDIGLRGDSLIPLCEAFIIGGGEVMLFDKINGKIISKIQNNNELEIHFSVKILYQSGDWFHVITEAEGRRDTGWIKNQSTLATYSRNYRDTLRVYDYPSGKGIVCSIPDYFTSPMNIVECQENWIKVRISDNNYECEGWILKSMTCPNPYSTCP